MTKHTDDAAIDLAHVEKTYRRRIRALDGVAVRVRRGEVFGLLGPNGAGKSTLVKILMTIVRPNRVEGKVLGQPVGHKPTLARVGYLPENHRFPRYLTGRRVMEFYAAMSGVERRTGQRRAGELLEVVGMSDWANTKVSDYSKGMMQRVGLAQALVHDPQLVLLDEPTDGVDPVGRRDIRDAILRLREQGKTVFINSHLLSELEMICDRVAILVQGRVARQGTLDELTMAHQHFEITFGDGASVDAVRDALRTAAVPSTDPGSAGPWRGKTTDGLLLELEDRTLRVSTTEAAAVQPIIDALRGADVVIDSLRRVRPSLEDLFMQTVRETSSPGKEAVR